MTIHSLTDIAKRSVISAGLLIVAAFGSGCGAKNQADEEAQPMATPDDTQRHSSHETHGHSASPSPHEEGGHGHHVKHTPEEWAERLDSPERESWQKPEDVIGMLGIAPGQTVAEIGAGTGYFMKYLSEAVGPDGRVIATDVEADLIAHMKTRAQKEGLANVAFIKCPFDDPALPPEGVDRILIVNTWHHLSNRVAYAQKLIHALRPGGALYIVEFNKDSSVGPPPEEKLEPSQVLSDLEPAGFKTALLDENLPEQFVVRATR